MSSDFHVRFISDQCTVTPVICQACRQTAQGNVKVGVKSLVSAVSGTLKSEIRISKLETIPNFKYQMIKTFQIFTQHLRGSSRLEFWISDFVLRIYRKSISKQFSLSQQVISLNDVALADCQDVGANGEQFSLLMSESCSQILQFEIPKIPISKFISFFC